MSTNVQLGNQATALPTINVTEPSAALHPASNAIQPTSTTINAVVPERSCIEMITDAFWSIVTFFKEHVLSCFFSDTNGIAGSTNSSTNPTSTTQANPTTSSASSTSTISTTSSNSTPQTREEGILVLRGMLERLNTEEMPFPGELDPNALIIEDGNTAHYLRTNQQAWDDRQAVWTNMIRQWLVPAIQNALDRQINAGCTLSSEQLREALRNNNVEFDFFQEFLREGGYYDLQNPEINAIIDLLLHMVAELSNLPEENA